MAGQFLGLSLFIILLSFFIILNALSDFNEVKSSPVLKSVNMAFAGAPIGESDAPSIEQVEQTIADNKGDTLDKIEALFSTQISSLDAQRNRFGSEMMMKLPVAEFEEMMRNLTPGATIDEADIMSDTPDFMPTLVSLIETESTGVAYRMDILLYVQNVSESDERENLTKKVSGWTDILEQNGMPKKYVTSGFDYAEDSYVSLKFRRYLPVSLAGAESIGGIGGDRE